jgi:hypothetical protein
MGRPRKQQDDQFTNLSDIGTSSVANRKAVEAERQALVNEERARIVEETKKAQKQTADFIASKPTDSRTIADTR